MDELLKMLLAAHGSLGFADTLQALTNTKPYYEHLRKPLQGQVSTGPRGLTLGLNPKKVKDVPFALGHEFGHIAGSGVGNPAMGDEFQKHFPKAYIDEGFANDFSTVVNLLRNEGADTSVLNDKQKRIAEIVLRQPIYKGRTVKGGALSALKSVERQP